MMTDGKCLLCLEDRRVTLLSDDGACPIHGMPEKTVKERIIDMLNKQTEKGYKKYGHTLDDCPDNKFDWRLMAMEEMIDCMQYQQKEIMRLERLLNP